jgi:hypothetical protein
MYTVAPKIQKADTTWYIVPNKQHVTATYAISPKQGNGAMLHFVGLFCIKLVLPKREPTLPPSVAHQAK